MPITLLRALLLAFLHLCCSLIPYCLELYSQEFCAVTAATLLVMVIADCCQTLPASQQNNNCATFPWALSAIFPTWVPTIWPRSQSGFLFLFLFNWPGTTILGECLSSATAGLHLCSWKQEKRKFVPKPKAHVSMHAKKSHSVQTLDQGGWGPNFVLIKSHWGIWAKVLFKVY